MTALTQCDAAQKLRKDSYKALVYIFPEFAYN